MKQSLRQPSKQFEPMDSTQEGMQIDCSDEQSANALSSKTVTQQPLSNVAVERVVQKVKQWSEIAVTEKGTQIDRRDAQT
jgi:hypothetical protein